MTCCGHAAVTLAEVYLLSPLFSFNQYLKIVVHTPPGDLPWISGLWL